MNPMAYRLLPFPALSHQSLRTMSPVKTSTTKVHAVSKREAEASASTTLTSLPYTQAIPSLAYTSLPYAHSNLPYIHNNLPYVHNNLPYVHNTMPYA